MIDDNEIEFLGTRHAPRPVDGPQRQVTGEGTRGASASAAAGADARPLTGIKLQVIDSNGNHNNNSNEHNELVFRRSSTSVVHIGRRPGSEPDRSGEEGEYGKALFRCAVVSRRHAKIAFSDSGNAYLIDLNSHHGTHVCKAGEETTKTMTAETPMLLSTGDVVTFGKSVGKNEECVRPVVVRVELMYPPQPTSSSSTAIPPLIVPSRRYRLSTSSDSSSDSFSDIEEIPAPSQSSNTTSNLGRAFDILKHIQSPLPDLFRRNLYQPSSPPWSPRPFLDPIPFWRDCTRHQEDSEHNDSDSDSDASSDGDKDKDCAHSASSMDIESPSPPPEQGQGQEQAPPVEIESPEQEPEPPKSITVLSVEIPVSHTSPQVSLTQSSSHNPPASPSYRADSEPSALWKSFLNNDLDASASQKSADEGSTCVAAASSERGESPAQLSNAEDVVMPAAPPTVDPNPVEGLREELAKLQTDIEALQTKHVLSETRCSSSLSRSLHLFSRISSRIYSLETQKNTYFTTFDERLGAFGDEIKKCQGEIRECRGEVGEAQREVDDLYSELDDRVGQLYVLVEESQDKVEELAEKMDNVEEDLKGFRVDEPKMKEAPLLEREEVKGSILVLRELVEDMKLLRTNTQRQMAIELEAVRVAREEAVKSMGEIQRTLKRKREDDDLEEVDDDNMKVTDTQQEVEVEALPPPKKRKRAMVGRVVVQTATAITLGAVAAWGALAYS